MKKYINGALILTVILFMTPFSLLAQEKLAQSGFQFLNEGTNGRASAMGDAFTTMEGASTVLLYNPAGLARITSFADLSVSWNKWIADIKYNSVTFSLAPHEALYGVFGLSFIWIDYGEFLGTMFWNNDKGYIDTENFSPRAMAVGFGYGKRLSDKFSIGGQIKYVTQTSGKSVIPDDVSGSGLKVKKYSLSVTAFDFGTIYNTGFKSLKFGMSVRNFSQEIKYEQEGFQLPLTFRIGLSMNLMDFMEKYAPHHSVLLAIDAVHPRDHNEFICLGLEYTFMNIFSLRTGYVSTQSEYSFSYGLGIEQFGLTIDYAYIPFGVFNDVQKITVHYAL